MQLSYSSHGLNPYWCKRQLLTIWVVQVAFWLSCIHVLLVCYISGLMERKSPYRSICWSPSKSNRSPLSLPHHKFCLERYVLKLSSHNHVCFASFKMMGTGNLDSSGYRYLLYLRKAVLALKPQKRSTFEGHYALGRTWVGCMILWALLELSFDMGYGDLQESITLLSALNVENWEPLAALI